MEDADLAKSATGEERAAVAIARERHEDYLIECRARRSVLDRRRALRVGNIY
jgi:hypothetical protein